MLTLGTQRDLTNDMLIKGIIDSVVTVNQFYQMLPFKGIQGNALAYNREAAGIDQTSLVDVLRTGVNGINKAQQTFTRHSTELTTIIGDAQVNGLIQAVGSDYNDATAVQVAAKAKGIGRRYMDLLINGTENVAIGTTSNLVALSTATIIGTGTTNNFSATDYSSVVNTGETQGSDRVATDISTLTLRQATSGALVIDGSAFAFPLTSGLAAVEVLTTSGAGAYNAALRVVYGNLGFDGLSTLVVAAGRSTTGGKTTGAATLARLDQLIDSVHDKDGMVDYMMLNSAGVRKITAAFRGVGSGFDMMDVKTSSGALMSIQSYRGVPIFRNDFVNTPNDAGVASLTGGDAGSDFVDAAADIYVGTLDDGSFSHGICGLTAMNSAGMQVQKLGAREDVDADITRVKWYCGLAHFSELGLVRGQI